MNGKLSLSPTVIIVSLGYILTALGAVAGGAYGMATWIGNRDAQIATWMGNREARVPRRGQRQARQDPQPAHVRPDPDGQQELSLCCH